MESNLPEKNMDRLDIGNVENKIQFDGQVGEVALPKPNSKKTQFLFGILLVLVVTTLSIIGLLFLNREHKSENSALTPKQVDVGETLPTTNPSNSQPNQEKNWVLKKITEAGTESVLQFPNGRNQIVGWGDYLIYGSGDYSSNVQVYSYNLKTDEIREIYDQASRQDFDGGRNNRYVSSLQVLNNTLFFSIGGYMTSGANFWMTLPPTGQVQKLAGGAYGEIQYWKDKYWLISGTGDACWGSVNYALIDLTSKEVTEIATSTTGCYEGEEYVDIDQRGQMLLAFHTAGNGGNDEASNGIYQYVVAVPLNKPTAKKTIIAKQDMPSGITMLRYLTDTDELLLIGPEKYLFDFSTQTIKKTDLQPPEATPSIDSQAKNFEDRIKELTLPSGFEFSYEE